MKRKKYVKSSDLHYKKELQKLDEKTSSFKSSDWTVWEEAVYKMFVFINYVQNQRFSFQAISKYFSYYLDTLVLLFTRNMRITNKILPELEKLSSNMGESRKSKLSKAKLNEEYNVSYDMLDIKNFIPEIQIDELIFESAAGKIVSKSPQKGTNTLSIVQLIDSLAVLFTYLIYLSYLQFASKAKLKDSSRGNEMTISDIMVNNKEKDYTLSGAGGVPKVEIDNTDEFKKIFQTLLIKMESELLRTSKLKINLRNYGDDYNNFKFDKKVDFFHSVIEFIDDLEKAASLENAISNIEQSWKEDPKDKYKHFIFKKLYDSVYVTVYEKIYNLISSTASGGGINLEVFGDFITSNIPNGIKHSEIKFEKVPKTYKKNIPIPNTDKEKLIDAFFETITKKGRNSDINLVNTIIDELIDTELGKITGTYSSFIPRKILSVNPNDYDISKNWLAMGDVNSHEKLALSYIWLYFILDIFNSIYNSGSFDPKSNIIESRKHSVINDIKKYYDDDIKKIGNSDIPKGLNRRKYTDLETAKNRIEFIYNIKIKKSDDYVIKLKDVYEESKYQNELKEHVKRLYKILYFYSNNLYASMDRNKNSSITNVKDDIKSVIVYIREVTEEAGKLLGRHTKMAPDQLKEVFTKIRVDNFDVGSASAIQPANYDVIKRLKELLDLNRDLRSKDPDADDGKKANQEDVILTKEFFDGKYDKDKDPPAKEVESLIDEIIQIVEECHGVKEDDLEKIKTDESLQKVDDCEKEALKKIDELEEKIIDSQGKPIEGFEDLHELLGALKEKVRHVLEVAKDENARIYKLNTYVDLIKRLDIDFNLYAKEIIKADKYVIDPVEQQNTTYKKMTKFDINLYDKDELFSNKLKKVSPGKRKKIKNILENTFDFDFNTKNIFRILNADNLKKIDEYYRDVWIDTDMSKSDKEEDSDDQQKVSLDEIQKRIEYDLFYLAKLLERLENKIKETMEKIDTLPEPKARSSNESREIILEDREKKRRGEYLPKLLKDGESLRSDTAKRCLDVLIRFRDVFINTYLEISVQFKEKNKNNDFDKMLGSSKRMINYFRDQLTPYQQKKYKYLDDTDDVYKTRNEAKELLSLENYFEKNDQAGIFPKLQAMLQKADNWQEVKSQKDIAHYKSPIYLLLRDASDTSTHLGACSIIVYIDTSKVFGKLTSGKDVYEGYWYSPTKKQTSDAQGIFYITDNGDLAYCRVFVRKQHQQIRQSKQGHQVKGSGASTEQSPNFEFKRIYVQNCLVNEGRATRPPDAFRKFKEDNGVSQYKIYAVHPSDKSESYKLCNEIFNILHKLKVQDFRGSFISDYNDYSAMKGNSQKADKVINKYEISMKNLGFDKGHFNFKP